LVSNENSTERKVEIPNRGRCWWTKIQVALLHNIS